MSAKYATVDCFKGMSYLGQIENICLKKLKEPNFFVEPWKNKELFHGTIIETISERGSARMKLWILCPTDNLQELTAHTGNCYLYGATGQVNVLQLRVKGNLCHVHDDALASTWKKKISTRFLKEKIMPPPFSKYEERDTKIYMRRLFRPKTECQLFEFSPSDYATSWYQRG
jgi:hypothetical protein